LHGWPITVGGELDQKKIILAVSTRMAEIQSEVQIQIRAQQIEIQKTIVEASESDNWIICESL